jgi:hypothetical protein
MDLEALKQSTKESREYDNLRQYPLSIRQFRQKSSMEFDSTFDYRSTDTFLQRFLLTKYPIGDRTFGSPNGNICNLFLNLFNQPEVDVIRNDMLLNREWVYHPVRPFEKWNNISKLYYDNESYFWLILLFNKIIDPFAALKDLSMVKIPNFTFLQRLPYRFEFEYDQAE